MKSIHERVADLETRLADLEAGRAPRMIQKWQRPAPRQQVTEAGLRILRAVGEAYGVKIEDLTGPTRVEPLGEARAVVVHLLRRHVQCTYSEAAAIVNRTTSNVIKNDPKVARKAARLPRFAAMIEQIAEKAGLTPEGNLNTMPA